MIVTVRWRVARAGRDIEATQASGNAKNKSQTGIVLEAGRLGK
jgi:hypothetical protein